MRKGENILPVLLLYEIYFKFGKVLFGEIFTSDLGILNIDGPFMLVLNIRRLHMTVYCIISSIAMVPLHLSIYDSYEGSGSRV